MKMPHGTNGLRPRSAASLAVYLTIGGTALFAVGCSNSNPSGQDGSTVASGDGANTQSTTQGEAATRADATTQDTATQNGTSDECPVVGEGLNPDAFVASGLAQEITMEECTLIDGTETMCYRVAGAGLPPNHETGPYCPVTVDDGPEAGGKWPDSGQLWDIDGDFIIGLPEFYDNDGWELWDPETGLVNRVFSPEDCEQAAQLNSGVLNVCIDCTIDALGGPVVYELLIPAQPIPAEAVTPIVDGLSPGISLSGIRIDFPAGVDIILSEFQIAALDDCGGHVNNAAGYHYHESTGCLSEHEQCDDHAPLIGYAVDGYAIHALAGTDEVEPKDIDECRGHTDEIRGYHYHASPPGANQFINCLRGVRAENVGGPPGGGGGGPPGGGGGPPPD